MIEIRSLPEKVEEGRGERERERERGAYLRKAGKRRNKAWAEVL